VAHGRLGRCARHDHHRRARRELGEHANCDADHARPTTIIIANLAGAFGQNEHLLPAAGFVQAFFPLVVFFALQRYFIRGILAGSIKQ